MGSVCLCLSEDTLNEKYFSEMVGQFEKISNFKSSNVKFHTECLMLKLHT